MVEKQGKSQRASDADTPADAAPVGLSLAKDLAAHWGVSIISHLVVVQPTLAMIFRPLKFPSNIEGGATGIRRSLAYLVATIALVSIVFDFAAPPDLPPVGDTYAFDGAGTAPAPSPSDRALKLLLEAAGIVAADLLLTANAVVIYFCGRIFGSPIRSPVTVICGTMYLLGLHNLVYIGWGLPLAHLTYELRDNAASILMPIIWVFCTLCDTAFFGVIAIIWAARILKLNIVQALGATAAYAFCGLILFLVMAAFSPSPFDLQYGAG